MGYHRAGFDVVGVDINPQPHYPFEFHQADAMTYPLDGFDAIHASPPCQAYSTISRNDKEYPDLYKSTRERISAIGVPYVIENVIGAPYRSGFVLCGSMFDMKVRRHRNFEASFLLLPPACRHAEQGRPYTITGNGGGCAGRHSLKPPYNEFPAYMEMPWATPKEATQAVPPAYTQYIGEQLLQHVKAAA